MSYKNIFSERLIELRKSHNLLQKDIANYLGVTIQAYSLWEKANRSPSVEILIALANYFDVSIDYLVGRTDTPYCEEYLFKIEKELLRHMPYTGIPAKYKDPTLRNQHYSIDTRLKIIALMKIMVNDAAERAERYQKNMERLESSILNDANALIDYGLKKIGLKSTIYEIDHDERNRQIELSQNLHNLLNNAKQP